MNNTGDDYTGCSEGSGGSQTVIGIILGLAGSICINTGNNYQRYTKHPLLNYTNHHRSHTHAHHDHNHLGNHLNNHHHHHRHCRPLVSGCITSRSLR